MTTNLDDLRRLREEAMAAGPGSGRWIKAAQALMDAFPGYYATAQAMNARAAAAAQALRTVADWSLPDTGEFWPSGGPVSYEAAKGSNGARDYMRGIAAQALAMGLPEQGASAPAEASGVVELTITDQDCYDLMVTASEGGINYWADIIKRKGQKRDDSTIPDIVSFEADVQDGPVSCDHPDIEAAEVGRFTIDPGMIRDGIRRLLAPGAKISPAIRADVMLLAADPEHGPDADSADAIVQFAVFGELVFG